MITAIVLAITAICATGLVFWPIWQEVRWPWALQVPNGDDEALHHEQAFALEALRDLAMDFKLGNLSQADYRALAIPLQERTKRTLALQAERQREQDQARHKAELEMAEMDALLEARILSLRHVPSTEAAVGGAAARFCPQCGAPAPAGYRFCAGCGARLPVSRAVRQQIRTARRKSKDGRVSTDAEEAALAQSPGEVAGLERGERVPESKEQAPRAPIPASETPSPAQNDQRASLLPARPAPPWLWAAGAIGLLWVAGIIWLYQGSRASQQLQVPIASVPDVRVQSLAVTSSGLVMGVDNGIRVSADGRNWMPRAASGDIRAVVPLDEEGQLWLAAGPAGLLRSQDGTTAWQPVESVPADLAPLTLAAVPGAPAVLWATDPTRLYNSLDGGMQWTMVDYPLPGRPRVLVAGAQDLFLGTDQGVFRSQNNGRSWSDYTSSIINTDVWALAYDEPNNLLYAGTPSGVSFQKLDAPGGWGQRQLQADVTMLALSGDNNQELWAGTRTGQLYWSRDRGVTWQP